MTDTPFTGLAGNGRLLDLAGNGDATLERDGEATGCTCYQGCRAAYLGPDPRDPSRLIVHIEGGIGGGPDLEPDDAVLFSISPAGFGALLEQLQGDLRAHVEGRAIDMRFIV